MQYLKWFLLGSLIVLFNSVAFPQQLKLGKNPSIVTKSAVLELESDNQGLLFPRITDTSLISAINPPDGMVIFQVSSLQLLLRTGGYWRPLTITSALNNYWSINGNNNTTASNFIGTTNDVSMAFRSNNQPFLELGRRQTLGLWQNFADYNNNDEKVTYVRSALQFEAAGADFYKPKIFVDAAGNFRVKGSSAGTDYFEFGATGTNNAGGFDFIIGDDGDEPIIFKSNHYSNGTSEIMRLQSGRMALGSNAFSVTYPEKLLVDAGTTTSYNLITGKGSINNYLQFNIKNQSAGTSASSDLVASADNGDESTNFVDLGINSSGYTNVTSPVLGGINNAYLYSTGNDFIIGNATATKPLRFFTGGYALSNEAMRIDGTGNVGIGTLSPSSKLHIFGANPLTLTGVQTGTTTSSDSLLTITNGVIRKLEIISITGLAITSLNGLTATTQTFATPGTTGTAPSWSSATSVHTLNIPLASAGSVTAGLLSNTDYTAFNNKWSLSGNTSIDPASHFLGTTGAQPVIFKTTGIERMRIDATGSIGIGSSTFDGINKEKLLIDAGTTVSPNLIEARGTIDNYLQMNVRNQSGGVNASSNISVTANNASSTSNYINLGMNSGAFSNTGNPILNGINYGYLYSTGSDFLIGNSTALKPIRFFAGGLAAANERMRIDGNTGNIGIAKTAPAEKLDIFGNLRFSGALMPGGAPGSIGYVLTSGGTGVAPTWQDGTTYVTSNAWVLGGNTLTGERSLGPLNAYDLPFITGNTEKMRIANTGNVKIGAASAFDLTNPEKFLVDVGTTGNFNVIAGKGSIDSYLQLNIQNKSFGTSASSDIVATNNIGNESINFIDMGINSTTYTSNTNILSGPSNAYLYATGNDFMIGNATALKHMRFFTGGVLTTNERMKIDSVGNVSIGISSLDATHPEKFIVNAGTTNSVNAIVGKGSINNYLQLNIKNEMAGTNASSDVVATANNGSETTNFIDMGINSGSNTSGVMGVANDAYLYNIGQDLLIGTGTATKSLIFLTGGTSEAANERMRIDGNGNVGIGRTNPSQKLDVNGSLNVQTSIFVDAANANNGTLSPGIVFGSSGSGEGISTKRTGGGNQYGLDFYTASNNRMSIDNSGDVGIGTTTPNSKLSVNGSVTMKFRNVAGTSTTILSTDYMIINTTGGTVTWTLPAANTCTGRVYILVNHGTSSITLSPGVKNANGVTATTFSQVAGSNTAEIISDGSEWRKFN